MEVDAVDNAVGMLVAGAKCGTADGNARELGARRAVAHDQKLREEGERADRVVDSQALEHLERVGADLDAGTDLAELRSLLEHVAREALLRQRQRRGEAADAAAGDQNGA